MKKLILTVTALGLLAMNAPTAKAGDREWATVGKVLTGVAAVGIIANVIDAHTHVAVTYSEPAYCPSPAVIYAPAPYVVYAPPPRVLYHAPVVYRSPVRYVPRVADHHGHNYRNDRADHDRDGHQNGYRR